MSASENPLPVDVHLHTILQRQAPGGRITHLALMLPEGSTVGDVLRMLGIEMPEETLLLVVNGRMTDEHHVLQANDQLNLMPALSGGSK